MRGRVISSHAYNFLCFLSHLVYHFDRDFPSHSMVIIRSQRRVCWRQWEPRQYVPIVRKSFSCIFYIWNDWVHNAFSDRQPDEKMVQTNSYYGGDYYTWDCCLHILVCFSGPSTIDKGASRVLQDNRRHFFVESVHKWRFHQLVNFFGIAAVLLYSRWFLGEQTKQVNFQRGFLVMRS